MKKISRRDFINHSLTTAAWFASIKLISSCHADSSLGSFGKSNLENISPLLPPDKNGIRLPEGFTSKIIAQANQPVRNNSNFKWHFAPDGGACFRSENNGWIYVSNSELGGANGGVGAISFDSQGEIMDAYSILNNTHRNCAGGKTPYNTWLSCEEVQTGLVYECDPFGKNPAIVRPALGVFNHEAAAYDIDTHHLYLTEDMPDGGFYRFVATQKRSDGYADLSNGQLQIAEITNPSTGSIKWHDVPDPSAKSGPTRYQVIARTPFNGGEGMDIVGRKIYFTTKGDNRLWVYDCEHEKIAIAYDKNTSSNPILSGVDNVHANDFGDILVAEDGGDMQIVVITANGSIKPLLQIPGHTGSEITGPAFSPDQTRLYFSSQRGASGSIFDGITYEITGPFFKHS